MIGGVIVLTILIAITLLLLVPPLIWHCQAKNIPAVCLITSFSIVLLKSFINLIVWSGDDFEEVWDGQVYCDIAVRLEEGAAVGRITAVAALSLNLYMVLRAENPIFMSQSNWKKCAIDLSICLITPIFVMCTSYYVQSSRYFILKYRGCITSLTSAPAVIPLNAMWSVLWSLVALVFACLTLLKYFQKRKDVNDILRCTNSGLDLKRFARLLIFCFLIILVLTPFSIYFFVGNVTMVLTSIPTYYDRSIIFYRDFGLADSSDMFTNIALSILTFLVFGLGSDAVAMYKRVLPRFSFFERKVSEDNDTDSAESLTRNNTEVGFPRQVKCNSNKSQFTEKSDSTVNTTVYEASTAEFKFNQTELIYDLESSVGENSSSSPFELDAHIELEKDNSIRSDFGYNFQVIQANN